MIAGAFIGISINGAFVSCETSCQINFNQNMLPASAVDSGGWAEFIAGLRSWTVSVSGNLLLESVPTDIKAMITTGYINQYPMFCEFKTSPASDIQMSFSGAVLFSQGSISAASTGVANWTLTLNGTGVLQTSYQDFALLIDALPAEKDYPLIINTQEYFTT